MPSAFSGLSSDHRLGSLSGSRGLHGGVVVVAIAAVAAIALLLGAVVVSSVAWKRAPGPAVSPDRAPMVAATNPAQQAARCAECHRQEYEDWLASQHANAQRPTGEMDRKAFAGAPVSDASPMHPDYSGGQPGFRNPETNQFYPALSAIGIEPLVQFLLPTENGRLQIAPLSYDPHKGDWFDAQSPPRDPADWSFWANRGMNWNSQCAYCHMTDLQKNYDIATDSYATTWTAMGISCSQCHGDMSAHLADPEAPGLARTLPTDQVIANCASCHSRREELTGAFHPGEHYDDHYRLELADRPGIYYPNGIAQDENFEYGGLMLSRMGHAGITCLDCHNPHSAGLVLPVENNALCMSCHTPPGIDGATPIVPENHLFHTAGEPGGRCIDCHMPENTYMVRDPRRDHSFTSPDAQLTIELGIPNACNACHNDQSAEWARDWTNTWYGSEKMEGRRARARARVIAQARQGAEFDPQLLVMAESEEIAAWRASLILLLAPWNRRPEVAEFLEVSLANPAALVRSAAVRAISAFENPVQLPRALASDPTRLVRLDAAWADGIRGRPIPDRTEIEAYLANQSDQPSGAVKQAQLALASGEPETAVAWARKAADWDRSSAGAREMLAMILYAADKRDEARIAFEQAITLEPANANLPFSLALLLAEDGDIEGAIAAFEKAVAADEGFGRAWYNLGLAYSQYGDPRKALTALARAEESSPGSPDPAYAAATIHLRLREFDSARHAIHRALKIVPGHPPSRALLHQIPQ
jgi:predicted CXXCH cytochrome family protein